MNVKAFKNYLTGNGWRCIGHSSGAYFMFEKKNYDDKLHVYYHRSEVFSIELHSRIKATKIEIKRDLSFLDFSEIVKTINSNLALKKSLFETFYNNIY
jgi:hypothetical protein